MDDYKLEQKNLVTQLEELFACGNSKSTVTPMQQDYFNDDQIGLTSVTKISPAICNIISDKVIHPLMEIDPDQFYFPPESLHLTIKNVRMPSRILQYTQDDILKVNQLFSELIPKFPAFSFDIEGAVLFPTSISVMAYSDKILGELVTSLDRGLKKIGVPDDKKYLSDLVFWGNITVCRFTKTPSKQFLNKVRAMRNIKFGELKVEKIRLITTNSVLSPKYLNIIAEYGLK